MTKIVLKKNKAIQKEDYKKDKEQKKLTDEEKKEYYYDKQTNVVPKKTNRLLCVFFTEDKKCYFLWRKYNPFKNEGEIDFFRFKKGMYIVDNSGVHITDNNIRIAFYMEGISTPIKLGNIEKEEKTVTYIDLQGKEQKSIIQKIKGLKFDAKIMDIFLNRRFAEIFTKKKIKGIEIYLLIFSLITIVMVAVGYGVTYFYG